MLTRILGHVNASSLTGSNNNTSEWSSSTLQGRLLSSWMCDQPWLRNFNEEIDFHRAMWGASPGYAGWKPSVQRTCACAEMGHSSQLYCNVGSTVSCQIAAVVGLQCDSLSGFYIDTDIMSICGTTACFQKMGVSNYQSLVAHLYLAFLCQIDACLPRHRDSSHWYGKPWQM